MKHVLQGVLVASLLVQGAYSTWTLCPHRLADSAPQVPCINVSLPMSVHESLFAAGIIGDPLGPGRDSDYRWIAESDWSLSAKSLEGGNIVRLKGVTAVADIQVNGYSIGVSRSAFKAASFLLASESEKIDMKIILKSIVKEAAKLASQGSEVPQCTPPEQNGFCGVQYLRVPQYLFGWDFGIATGSIGIDSVSFDVEYRDLLVDTVLNEDLQTWSVKVHLDSYSPLRYSLSDSSGTVISSEENLSESFTFNITGVTPWFPRGYGLQSLYNLEVCSEEDPCITKRIGFRHIETIKETSSWYLEFNRVKRIYILGVNTVPSSAFRDWNEKEIDDLIETVIAQNANMIRIWGGGWYGRDYLYDKADDYGILIWEEIKLACASYPVDMLSQDLLGEIKYHLARIYSHPSLAIISGNNEVHMMLEQNWYDASSDAMKDLMSKYGALDRFVSQIVNETPQNRFMYIPSSPTDGIDAHYYDYSVDCLDSRSFPNDTTLVSEFGYHSWCTGDCLSKIFDEAELKQSWRDSPKLATRQHRANGNVEMWNQITKIISDVSDQDVSVEAFAWMSQISQAVCLKAASETFRRQATNNGFIYWQLNDVWPTASWSTVDYLGNWKPSFYSTEAVFADQFVSLFVENESLVIAQRSSVAMNATIDFRLQVIDLLDGRTSVFHISTVIAEPHAYKELYRVNVGSVCPVRSCVAATSWQYIMLGPVDRRQTKWSVPYLRKPVDFLLSPDRKSIFLSAKIPTPFIFLSHPRIRFERNFLFLQPGEVVMIGIEPGTNEELNESAISVESIWSHLAPHENVVQDVYVETV